MARFDPEYLADVDLLVLLYVQLKNEYLQVCNMDSKDQSEKFKIRFVLTLGENVLVLDDRVSMFEAQTKGENYFELNDPNLNKYLEQCNIKFDSAMVRNQQLGLFSPMPKSDRMCFIQLTLHCFKDEILQEYFKRWKLTKKSQRVVLKNPKHQTQAVLSEFLRQPPYGVDKDLDNFTKQERETKVDYFTKVNKLQDIVDKAKEKEVMSVSEKRAVQELAILQQTDIEQKITYIRTQVNKLSRKVMKHQKATLSGLYTGLTAEYKPVIENQRSMRKTNNSAQNTNPPPAPAAPKEPEVVSKPWEAFFDEGTEAYYYYNHETGVTQWTKP